jgi:hypothetical protein
MLELNNQKAKLNSINGRAEKHGDNKVLTADLKLTIKVSNDILSEFDPALKSALYKKADNPQGELIKDASHLPALKFPDMGSISWGAEFKDYTCTISHGIGGRSDIKFNECPVDKFRFTPEDGGTVEVTFRVIVHPTPEEVGKLYSHLESDVEVTLTPPEEETEEAQQELEAA